MFGSSVKIRFRPHFFPFTEPSVEWDASCMICGGKGCKVCKGTGWIEISGAGMVNPKVLENVGWDPNELSGYAFGMGIERIAMIRYAINDLRLLYENACIGKLDSTSKKISKVCDKRDKMGIKILGLMVATCVRVLPSGSTPTPHWDMEIFPRNSPPTTAILVLPRVFRIWKTSAPCSYL